MKRILVTGSAGFIGQAVCVELYRRGMEPIGFDHPNDIRNPEQLASMCGREYPDAIINLAGILGTAETIGAEREAAAVNILGALNVLDAASDLSIQLVQIATGHEGQPNPYAITKKCITDLALSRSQWTGQKISVVRAYHVYGPGQKMCPPHGHSTVRKIVPSFVARALTRMPIEINGDGLQKIDLVYLDDVAKVLVDALEGPYGEVVEAGTGISTSVLSAARMIIRSCESESKIINMPMRQGEPEVTTVVATKPLCPNRFPYKLKETIEWYRTEIGKERARAMVG